MFPGESEARCRNGGARPRRPRLGIQPHRDGDGHHVAERRQDPRQEGGEGLGAEEAHGGPPGVGASAATCTP